MVLTKRLPKPFVCLGEWWEMGQFSKKDENWQIKLAKVKRVQRYFPFPLYKWVGFCWISV